MTGKVLIPLAAIGLVFAIRTATADKPPGEARPFQEPPRSPFAACVAGAGLLEASTENVTVGAPVAGIVSCVLVKVGDAVHVGAPLFLLDDRPERANVTIRRAELEAARAKLDRLRQYPRPETIPPLEARVRECEVHLEDARVQRERWQSLVASDAVSRHEASLKRFAELAARHQLERARAELAETRAGSWGADVAVQECAVSVARAELERATVELDRLVVRAPVAGQILRVHVRAGEQVQPATGGVLLGDTDRVHVRVQIDEADAPRFRPGAPARAAIKGRATPTFPLRYVRTEPYVVPKRSLTGQSNERVDTRVLEVIYAIDGKAPCPIYVGQQVDAFIEEELR